MPVKTANNLGKILAAAYGGGLDGLLKAAKAVKASADQYVPVGETGLLEASGVVKQYDDNTVDVRYGGNGSYWGMIIHAHPEYSFQAGRQALWIESAVRDQRGIAKDIAAGYTAAFNRAGA